MKNKQQIKLGIILGTVLLLTLLGIVLFIKCPTEAQNNIFTVTLALSGAAFSMALTGQINVGYQKTITASGALAVFLVIFFWKPTQIRDFTGCNNDIRNDILKGTVYFGQSPEDNIGLLIINQNISTSTNINGNFSVDLHKLNEGEVVKIRLTKESIQLDTIISLSDTDFKKSLELKTNKYCVQCTHKDSLNNVIRVKNKCSSKLEFIKEYIKGFKESGREQNLITDCIINK